jgi:nitrite reductase/ring-hydroxylating ferredoxin subunit
MKWYKVLDFVVPEKPFLEKVRVGGKNICLGSDGSELFAVSAYCPHAGALLSGGWCREGEIICPIHRYSYNLKTGKGAPGQNDYINVYPVEKRGDEVYVGIAGFWEKVREGWK